jgi:branched-chain amino acid transport system ATP-binding protein
MNAAPAMRVTALSVTYGGVRAVDDVSFEVAPDRILGFVGPNGAGKTTLFDALCGFVPSRGRVVLADRDISELSPEQRARARLGRSFQDARLFPSLTVFETLCVASERHIRAEGVVSTALRAPWVRRTEKRVARRAEELIELMGLGAFRDKFVSELSTGSRRILDLAVILVHEPLVLLLDEPSSGIAQRETEALGPLLLRLREETGCTMLVIEHDMPLIAAVSDEIIALETGSVLCQGTPGEVLSDARLVEAYLGTNRAVVERSGRHPAQIVSTNNAPAKRAPAKRAPAAKTPAAKATAAQKAKAAAARKATAKKSTVVKKATPKPRKDNGPG